MNKYKCNGHKFTYSFITTKNLISAAMTKKNTSLRQSPTESLDAFHCLFQRLDIIKNSVSLLVSELIYNKYLSEEDLLIKKYGKLDANLVTTKMYLYTDLLKF